VIITLFCYLFTNKCHRVDYFNRRCPYSFLKAHWRDYVLKVVDIIIFVSQCRLTRL